MIFILILRFNTEVLKLPNNFLLTGNPGVGKTTVVKKVVSELRKKDYKIGGVYCPEIRSNGYRKGFKITDIMSDQSMILAHIDEDYGPRVSKYRVNVENIDLISDSAISKALREADLIIIDEIAPMEAYSNVFNQKVKEALESKKPLLGVIHKRSRKGFIGEVKGWDDIKMFIIDKENRDSLPNKLKTKIREKISE
ncbi:nucleoside triphosphatase [archaeon SCG-AAA382B04]|nr:nucleoside triphosphatase [archaeon SCG-AAA382B04]